MRRQKVAALSACSPWNILSSAPLWCCHCCLSMASLKPILLARLGECQGSVVVRHTFVFFKSLVQSGLPRSPCQWLIRNFKTLLQAISSHLLCFFLVHVYTQNGFNSATFSWPAYQICCDFAITLTAWAIYLGAEKDSVMCIQAAPNLNKELCGSKSWKYPLLLLESSMKYQYSCKLQIKK